MSKGARHGLDLADLATDLCLHSLQARDGTHSKDGAQGPRTDSTGKGASLTFIVPQLAMRLDRPSVSRSSSDGGWTSGSC